MRSVFLLFFGSLLLLAPATATAMQIKLTHVLPGTRLEFTVLDFEEGIGFVHAQRWNAWVDVGRFSESDPAIVRVKWGNIEEVFPIQLPFVSVTAFADEPPFRQITEVENGLHILYGEPSPTNVPDLGSISALLAIGVAGLVVIRRKRG